MNDLSERQAKVGIFLAGLATLMFELLVNKALAFSTWGTLGYMIIGSAVFGYSIAGVVLALWRPLRRYRLSSLVTGAALLFSVSVLLSYLVMNVVPFDFEGFLTSPLTQALYLACWYLVLLVPFSATGFIVAILLYAFKERSNRLYAADLVGAGLGCLLVVPSFPLLGAAGTYFVCAGLGALCAIAFARGRLPKLAAAAAGFLALCLVAAPYAQHVYPVKAHQHKRQRGEHFDQGFLTHSMWSFLSKIEVAQPPAEESGMLWFDGGLMQSAIDRFSGDLRAARTEARTSGENSLAYRLKPRKNVLIIAPAGGRELRAALAWGAERVTGVELDSSVVALVQGPLNEYLGGIYRDPRVVLVNDEGRSFVRRSKEEYDTIQFISAYSVPAVQSGAVDLASSYLMTVEAFEDYLDHLSDDGVLSVSRDLNVRLFTTAWTALERRGLDPRPRLVLLKNRASLGRNTLLAKLSPFGPDELALIKEVCQEHGIAVNYAPGALMRSVDAPGGLVSEPKTRRLLERFVQTPPPNRQQFFADLPYRSWPVYDNKPFFNAVRYIGNDLRSTSYGVTEEITELTDSTWYVPYIPIGDAPRLAVLAEGAVFALVFLLLPLWKGKSEGIETGWQRLSMLYFLALGLGFIWIEIVLLKTFILFLGNPVYSISVVLFAMLVSAGLGSLASERMRASLTRNLVVLATALVLTLAVVSLLYPILFRAALGLPFPARVGLGIMLIAPAGFVMGMPFPLGLRFLSESCPESIPWAWATNGYATVIGVASASLVALHIGFTAMFGISVLVYLIGFACLAAGYRRWSKSAPGTPGLRPARDRSEPRPGSAPRGPGLRSAPDPTLPRR